MSEEPKAGQTSPPPADVEVESSAETPVPTPPSPTDVSFTLRALIVAAVTFVVVLAMVIGIYVFNVTGKTPAVTGDADDSQTRQEAPSAKLVYVTIVEKNAARTLIGPQRDRSVTCIYTIVAGVPENRVDVVRALVDPGPGGRLPVVKEKIRHIIIRTEYLKLCDMKLDGAKLQIMQELNLLLGEDVIREVVVEDWSVTL